MFITKESMCECGKKPALTIHAKNNYTLSVLTVSVVGLIILLHVLMCKLSSCRKNKIKQLKKDNRELTQE